MNDLTATPGTELAALDAQLEARAALMKQNIKAGGSTISISKAGNLQLPDGSECEDIDLIVLDYRYRNVYYKKPFRQGEYNEPDCFAVGIQDNDNLTPEGVADPQSSSCKSCQYNQYGSHPQGRGKACHNQLLLAVAAPDTSTSEVLLLKASPTALQSVGGHLLRMADQYGHPIKVVTRFSVDQSRNYPRLAATFQSLNAAYREHAKLLSTAERVVTQMPTSSTSPADAPAAAHTSDRKPRVQ